MVNNTLDTTLYTIVDMYATSRQSYIKLMEGSGYRVALLRLFRNLDVHYNKAKGTTTGELKQNPTYVKNQTNYAKLTFALTQESATKITDMLSLTTINMPQPKIRSNVESEVDVVAKNALLTDNEKSEFDTVNTTIKNLANAAGFDATCSNCITLNSKKDVVQLRNNLKDLTIEMTQEEVNNLDPAQIESLGEIGVNLENKMIIPTSAQFVTNDHDVGYKGGMPSYTAIDMTVTLLSPHIMSEIRTLTTITYSMHSTITPVRVLGRSRPKGFAYGERTIAGTFIAVISRQDTFMALQPSSILDDTTMLDSINEAYKPYLMPDQLPMFDLSVTFTNEYGMASSLTIFGVKISDVGQVYSISDNQIEVQYTYQALDAIPLRAITKNNEKGEFDIHVADNDYLIMRNRLMKGAFDGKSPDDAVILYQQMNDVYKEIDFMRKEHQGQSVQSIAQSGYFKR